MSVPNAATRAERNLPRLVRDLEGAKIELTRDITTGAAVFPAGSRAVITNAGAWERFTIRGDACTCCGVKLIISRMSWRDFKVVS